MNELLKYLKLQNKKEIEEYEEGFFLNPISNEELIVLKENISRKFNLELSSEYLQLLSISNGFSVNGLNIYPNKDYDKDFFIGGLENINEQFHEEESLRKYFSYGEESSTRLVFNIAKQQYEAVDSVTWEEIKNFDCFSKLLSYVIKESCIFE